MTPGTGGGLALLTGQERFPTERTPDMGGGRWQDWAHLLLAVWLFLSPWVLGFADSETVAWNAWLVAVIVATAAVVSIGRYSPQAQWVAVVMGAWLIVSPWLLRTAALAPAAYWNLAAVGLAFVAVGGWNLTARRRGRGA